ncbi:hypothetical protein LY76DRAFT_22688 [Colletotrichum caudatum]|nr:hypothetical protein LY76DRAFT_22688 [Colletotrichum caudatum]
MGALSHSLSVYVRFFSSNCASGCFHTWKITDTHTHTHTHTHPRYLPTNLTPPPMNRDTYSKYTTYLCIHSMYAANKVMVCLGMTEHWPARHARPMADERL